MNTCKTCRWWDRGYCDFVNTTLAETPNTRFELILTAADDTDLEGQLRTGPDFGCIHHERTIDVRNS